MSWLARLEKKFGRQAVPGLVTYLIAVQVALYVINLLTANRQFAQQGVHELVALIPSRVMAGEVWRLATFLIEPPYMHPIWAFFYWYMLYFFANTLELNWGSFRLNLYLVVGWAATVLVALLVPELRNVPVTSNYLYTSLFLAFAHLYPDFELRLYFLLPVKVKWLALLTWLGMAYFVYQAGWPAFWIAAASVADFFLFLGASVWRQARQWWRGYRFKQRVHAGQAVHAAMFHECRVCGMTSKMAPGMQFRYCSKCDGQSCYCPEHVAGHEHVVSEKDAAAGAVREQ